MKIIICIVSIFICLCIGYRFANLDKPFERELWEVDASNYVEWNSTPLYINWYKVETDDFMVSADGYIRFRVGIFKTLTMEFADGHEETVDLEALQQAGSLETYFKDTK